MMSHLESRNRLTALGELIQRTRRARGLTRSDLAARVRVDSTQVSRWERGRAADLGIEHVRAIERALGLPGGTLLVATRYAPATFRLALADALGVARDSLLGLPRRPPSLR
jgi:transcriptional regulator with XRE-family HTH domain